MRESSALAATKVTSNLTPASGIAYFCPGSYYYIIHNQIWWPPSVLAVKCTEILKALGYERGFAAY